MPFLLFYFLSSDEKGVTRFSLHSADLEEPITSSAMGALLARSPAMMTSEKG